MPLPNEQLGARKALWIQLWQENPIFRQVLGICSALAVTNRMFNTLLMCGGLLWATSMSSLTVSLLRNYTPRRVRIMVSVLIIAVYVICVDIALRAWFPAVHKDISAYVGLIITNCIVLGRLEAFAGKNRPLPALADGFGAGLGYSFILMLVAVVRELLGFGTLFGLPLGALTRFWTASQAQWVIMIMPPGAFFVLAVVVWVMRTFALRREATKGGGA
jgi:Na+-transporting NADH:ubiquinone oxidoreductase subunit D